MSQATATPGVHTGGALQQLHSMAAKAQHLVESTGLTVNDSSDEQLVRSFQQLGKLRSLDLLGGQQLSGSFVGSVAAFTGLTALGLDRMLSVDVPSLPQSLVKASLTNEAADPSCNTDESWR